METEEHKMENEYLADYLQFQLLLELRTQEVANRYCEPTPLHDAGEFARFHLPGLADGIGPLHVLGCDCSLNGGKPAAALGFPPELLWKMRFTLDDKVYKC